jgi:hypothetical protein
MPTFETIRDSYRFIDWLVASARLEDLRWRNDAGFFVTALPNDDLFVGAADDLYDDWCLLSWYDQRFCILAAAEQLAEIEQLVAGAV